MSLLARLGGSARAQRRLLGRSDVRFCAALELTGFEVYHAVQGEVFHVVVPQHDHQPIAARAARLYFGDAAAIVVQDDPRPAATEGPVLFIRAEPLPKGRFRVVVEAKIDRE